MKELSLREIQLSSLNILKVVADICEKQSINYSLAYGSLLGAVRHKGFIPWDDDLDIMMSRPEYERFIEYFLAHQKEMYPLKLLNMDTEPKCPHVISRVTDTNYYLKVKNEKEYGLGTFIDIYVIDGLGDNEKEAASVIKKTMAYPTFIFLATRKHYNSGFAKGFLRKSVKFIMYLYAHFMGKWYFVNKLHKKLELLKYENSRYVGIAAWGGRPKNPYEKVMRKEWIENTFLVDFEQYKIRISKYYDEILKLNFGNYMQLPPPKDRVPHHLYKAYKKQL